MSTKNKPANKFARARTIDELQEYCDKKGWQFSRRLYDERGNDRVSFKWKVGRMSGLCVVSTWNGGMLGSTDSGIEFTSEKTDYDKTPWFKALLKAVYV